MKLKYKIAEKEDINLVMTSRLEMLREVNHLPAWYRFSEGFVEECRTYFVNGNQQTVLVLDEDQVVACASLSYLWVMPTVSHPTGKRAHLMNVYTKCGYRRQGIAYKMLEILIDEARKRDVTEISLDATEAGRPLYEKVGFTASEECMVLVL